MRKRTMEMGREINRLKSYEMDGHEWANGQWPGSRQAGSREAEKVQILMMIDTVSDSDK